MVNVLMAFDWENCCSLKDIQKKFLKCLVIGRPTLPVSLKSNFFLQNLKGCGMGPWLVLVSPCFRENVFATCKIGSFLCSFDNLLQKM